ncbi:hypothetical protein LXL04_020179 [Taraxacum kok-saghyz]
MNTTFRDIRINQNNNNISLAFDDIWVDEPSMSSLELRAYSDADCDNYIPPLLWRFVDFVEVYETRCCLSSSTKFDEYRVMKS